MWILSLICLYLLLGMVFGFKHVSNIKKPIIVAGEKEKALREMVGMHQFTPQGAEYYTELQELHITKGELLTEYKLWKENEFKYEFQSFYLAALLWPYYIFAITTNKKSKEVGR